MGAGVQQVVTAAFCSGPMLGRLTPLLVCTQDSANIKSGTKSVMNHRPKLWAETWSVRGPQRREFEIGMLNRLSIFI